jgi:hypothetical protein
LVQDIAASFRHKFLPLSCSDDCGFDIVFTALWAVNAHAVDGISRNLLRFDPADETVHVLGPGCGCNLSLLTARGRGEFRDMTMTRDERRALKLLASNQRGVTEALMLARGFRRESWLGLCLLD